MLRIWGRGNSINVQKVLWCCGELDIRYQRVDVGGPFFRRQQRPEYLRLNPNDLVPPEERCHTISSWVRRRRLWPSGSCSLTLLRRGDRPRVTSSA